MTESGVDIRTIGLFAAIGIPYLIKFLWAPLIDALDVPILSRLLGRRRGWLMLTQLWLMAAIVLLAFGNPALSPLAGRARGPHGRHRIGDPGHRHRCVPGREPAGGTSRPPAWPPMWPPTGSVRWSPAPARCSW